MREGTASAGARLAIQKCKRRDGGDVFRVRLLRFHPFLSSAAALAYTPTSPGGLADDAWDGRPGERFRKTAASGPHITKKRVSRGSRRRCLLPPPRAARQNVARRTAVHAIGVCLLPPASASASRRYKMRFANIATAVSHTSNNKGQRQQRLLQILTPPLPDARQPWSPCSAAACRSCATPCARSPPRKATKRAEQCARTIDGREAREGAF